MSVVPPATGRLLNINRQLEELPMDQVEDDKQKLISDLTGDIRWEALKESISVDITNLETLSGMVDGEYSVEEVGYRFLASRLAIYHLKKILILPEALAEALKHK
jgi:hypothetical protein